MIKDSRGKCSSKVLLVRALEAACLEVVEEEMVALRVLHLQDKTQSKQNLHLRQVTNLGKKGI
jgi:hypothetical protein